MFVARYLGKCIALAEHLRKIRRRGDRGRLVLKPLHPYSRPDLAENDHPAIKRLKSAFLV